MNRCKVLFLASLLGLLFLVFSFSLYSEEMAIISKADLKTVLSERTNLIKELSDYKIQFQTLDQKYQTLDQKYQLLDQKYQTSEQTLTILKLESNIRIQSLIELKKTTTFEFWKGFLVGAGVGAGVGTYAGLQLGVNVKF